MDLLSSRSGIGGTLENSLWVNGYAPVREGFQGYEIVVWQLADRQHAAGLGPGRSVLIARVWQDESAFACISISWSEWVAFEIFSATRETSNPPDMVSPLELVVSQRAEYCYQHLEGPCSFHPL